MEILRDVSVDWLKNKWYFFGASWLLLALGIGAYFLHGGLAYGIDFTGGTILKIKFSQPPDLEKIRDSLKTESAAPPLIQQYDDPTKNTVQIRMQAALGEEQNLEEGQRQVQQLLRKAFDPESAGNSKSDFNNVGLDALERYILQADPDGLKAQNKTTQEIDDYYGKIAQSLLDFRNITGEGLVHSLDELKGAPGVSERLLDSLKQGFYAGPFAVKGLESVGAVVGSDLRRRATLAVGLSFLGMLVYIGFRFTPIYGVGAIVALFHDVTITVGLFALTGKEISLTVVAALLTLVGYSMNDSIVVFDRVRENLRILRKESLYRILNLSINQTLSRTIMTSGMTFISVFALFLFGGEVLNGFAFALTVGIIIGTYSSIAIAAPIVEWWYRRREQKPRSA